MLRLRRRHRLLRQLAALPRDEAAAQQRLEDLLNAGCIHALIPSFPTRDPTALDAAIRLAATADRLSNADRALLVLLGLVLHSNPASPHCGLATVDPGVMAGWPDFANRLRPSRRDREALEFIYSWLPRRIQGQLWDTDIVENGHDRRFHMVVAFFRAARQQSERVERYWRALPVRHGPKPPKPPRQPRVRRRASRASSGTSSRTAATGGTTTTRTVIRRGRLLARLNVIPRLITALLLVVVNGILRFAALAGVATLAAVTAKAAYHPDLRFASPLVIAVAGMSGGLTYLATCIITRRRPQRRWTVPAWQATLITFLLISGTALLGAGIAYVVVLTHAGWLANAVTAIGVTLLGAAATRLSLRWS